jgi:pimeloyl-ACP methyl ester carboxylesterase
MGEGVIIAFAMMLLAGGCADYFLLHPSTGPADAGGAERHVLSSNDRSVEYFTARSAGAAHGVEPKAFVLEFCGNATRAEYITRYVADRWGRRPVEVWVMNYPGFGGSTGPATLSAIPAAALETYDELSRQAAGRPIFVTGNSLGTTAALYVASKRPVAGLILQNPPPLQRMILQRHGWWNAWLLAGPVVMQIPSELNALETAPRVKAPAVFVEAVEDSTVPAQYQQYIIDAYAGPKRIIRMEHSGHESSITGEDDRRLQEAINWLWEQNQPPMNTDGHR